MAVTPIQLTMPQATALVQATTLDIFNERNQTERRKLMTTYWEEGITCYSPFGVAEGFDAMDRVWDGLHVENQSLFIFEKIGPVWVNYNVIMQEWRFCDPNGKEGGMKGWDVIYIGLAGKVKMLYAMIEGVATTE